LESLTFSRPFSLEGTAGRLQLEHLAGRHILGVSHGTSDRSVGAEGYRPPPVEPMDGAIGPDDAMFKYGVGTLSDHLIDGGQRAIDIIRVQPC
jgi:hypothetical protein